MPSSLLYMLSLAGFAVHPLEEHFGEELAKFFSIRMDLLYVYRMRDDQHQYISLVFHDNWFCEAVLEVYHAPKKTRGKSANERDAQLKGLYRLYANVYREPTELMEAVSRAYPLTELPKSK